MRVSGQPWKVPPAVTSQVSIYCPTSAINRRVGAAYRRKLVAVDPSIGRLFCVDATFIGLAFEVECAVSQRTDEQESRDCTVSDYLLERHPGHQHCYSFSNLGDPR